MFIHNIQRTVVFSNNFNVSNLRGKPAEADLCEYAARVCYNSLDKFGSSKTFLQKKIVQSGHLSVLEHARFSVDIHLDILDIGEQSDFLAFISTPGVFYHNLFDIKYRLSFNLRHLIELNETNRLANILWEELEFSNLIKPLPPKEYREETYDGHYSENVIPLAFVPDMLLGSLTVLIQNISRTCSMQLLRHRTCSFSQESQRYVDMSKSEFVVPNPQSEFAHKFYDTYSDFYYYSLNAYNNLRIRGERKEDARYILPEATITKMVVTFPFAMLDNFITLRTSKHAQLEIRNIALLVKEYKEYLDNKFMSREIRSPLGDRPRKPTGFSGG